MFWAWFMVFVHHFRQKNGNDQILTSLSHERAFNISIDGSIESWWGQSAIKLGEKKAFPKPKHHKTVQILEIRKNALNPWALCRRDGSACNKSFSAVLIDTRANPTLDAHVELVIWQAWRLRKRTYAKLLPLLILFTSHHKCFKSLLFTDILLQ